MVNFTLHHKLFFQSRVIFLYKLLITQLACGNKTTSLLLFLVISKIITPKYILKTFKTQYSETSVTDSLLIIMLHIQEGIKLVFFKQKIEVVISQ